MKKDENSKLNKLKFISEQKSIELLKLIIYEKKSIKQSANYLNINYVLAKKIIKKFELKKLHFTNISTKNEYINLISFYNNKKKYHLLNQNNIYENFIINYKVTNELCIEQFYLLIKKFKDLKKLLTSLNNDIIYNQNMLNIVSHLLQYKNI